MQREVEIILTSQLGSYLTTPIFIVDPSGNLVYYNEPAGKVLGHSYDETGEMPADEWAVVFKPSDINGNPLSPDQLPLMVALKNRRPAFREMRITRFDGEHRFIEAVALPITGQAGRFLGAMALFWEKDAS